VGLALQALDGAKIQAAASSASGWNQAQMEKLLAALDAALDQTELKSSPKTRTWTRRWRACPPAWRRVRPCASTSKKAWPNWPPLAARIITPSTEARRMKRREQNRYADNAPAVADA